MKNSFAKIRAISNKRLNVSSHRMVSFTEGANKEMKERMNSETGKFTEREKRFLDLLDETPKLYKPQTRQLAKLTENGFGILWYLGIIEPNSKDYNKLKSFIGNTLNVYVEMDYIGHFDRLHIYNDDWSKIVYSICMPILLDDIADSEQKEVLNGLYKKNSKYGSERFSESRFADVVFDIRIERQNYVSNIIEKQSSSLDIMDYIMEPDLLKL